MENPPGIEKNELAVGTPVMYKDPKHTIPSKHFIKEIYTFTEGDRKGQVVYNLENEVGTIIQEGGVKKFVDKNSFEIITSENTKVETRDETKEVDSKEVALSKLREDREKLEEEKEKRERNIAEKKLEEEKIVNEGKPTDPIGDRIKQGLEKVDAKVNSAVENALGTTTVSVTPGTSTELSEEEKLRLRQKEIIAEKRREISNEFTKQNAESILAELEPSRENYTQAYEDAVKNKKSWLWEKAEHWIGGEWLGGKHRNKSVEEKSEETRNTKEAYSEHKQQALKEGRVIQDSLIEGRIAQFEAEGRSEEFIQAYRDRAEQAHRNYVTKKTGAEYERSKKELDAVWEKKKSKAGEFFNKAGEYIFHKPLLKHTIGNKWFRFAAGTVILGGSGLSVAFVANRTVRFLAGSIGTRFIVNGLLKQENTISRNLRKIEEKYRNGEIDESEYTLQRDNIDLKVNQLKRTKELLIIAGGYEAGKLGGDVLNFDHDHAVVSPDHPKETVSVTDRNTQTELEKTVPIKPNITDTLKEQPKPHIDSTSPVQNGGSAPVETQTPPSTPTPIQTAPTGIPDEHTIVRVGSGKGIEHAFRAQIEHDHALAEKLKDLYHYKGAIGTPEEIHKFSGVVAHQIALGEGYIGADGAERWVSGTASYDIDIEPNGEVVIHERSLDAQGNWSEPQNSTGTFETDIDKNASGAVYEQTHRGDAHHVDHIRKSIHESYHKPRGTMNQIIPEKYPVADLPTNISALPQAELPPTSLPHAELPPSSIQQHPTVPVQPMRTSPVSPRIYNPSMMNPGPRNPLSNIIGAAETTPSSGKSFLDILLEGFFGSEKPSMPSPLETAQNSGEGIA